jgi:hypothetical protein
MPSRVLDRRNVDQKVAGTSLKSDSNCCLSLLRAAPFSASICHWIMSETAFSLLTTLFSLLVPSSLRPQASKLVLFRKPRPVGATRLCSLFHLSLCFCFSAVVVFDLFSYCPVARLPWPMNEIEYRSASKTKHPSIVIDHQIPQKSFSLFPFPHRHDETETVEGFGGEEK